MSQRKKFFKIGLAASALLFNQAAAPNDDISGHIYHCEDLGIFELRHCPDNLDKTCVYAISVTETAANDFQLNVDDITTMPPTLIVKNLKKKGKRYVRGEIENSRLGILKLAKVSIRPSKDNEVGIDATGRLTIFTRSFSCSR